uniref:Ac78 n=1 Tax=Nesodiprion zhejiangensis nucleopolyhedrovirus TaxID=3135970 RepID=A0AAN0LHM1_9BACU
MNIDYDRISGDVVVQNYPLKINLPDSETKSKTVEDIGTRNYTDNVTTNNSWIFWIILLVGVFIILIIFLHYYFDLLRTDGSIDYV